MTDELNKSADRLIELAIRQEARIEALEAALREIAGWPSSCEEARNIARAALDKVTK